MTCSEKEKWDAELGRVAMRFVDRAGDVHPGIDDADRICQEFYEAMSAVINQMPHVQTTSEHSKSMCGAAPKVDPIAWYVTGCSTMLDEHDAKAEAKRCGGCAQAVPLYAAPQPPAGRPVQLPEPVAKVDDGRLKWHIPDSRYSLPVCYSQGTHKLYTEQQVRDILAQYGIN